MRPSIEWKTPCSVNHLAHLVHAKWDMFGAVAAHFQSWTNVWLCVVKISRQFVIIWQSLLSCNRIVGSVGLLRNILSGFCECHKAHQHHTVWPPASHKVSSIYDQWYNMKPGISRVYLDHVVNLNSSGDAMSYLYVFFFTFIHFIFLHKWPINKNNQRYDGVLRLLSRKIHWGFFWHCSFQSRVAWCTDDRTVSEKITGSNPD